MNTHNHHQNAFIALALSVATFHADRSTSAVLLAMAVGSLIASRIAIRNYTRRQIKLIQVQAIEARKRQEDFTRKMKLRDAEAIIRGLKTAE